MHRTENVHNLDRQPHKSGLIRRILLHNLIERPPVDILQHHNVIAVFFFKLTGFDYAFDMFTELLQQPVFLLKPHNRLRSGKFGFQHF
ncbi:hypothetical protein D3C81_1454640 [compost metagenome]